MTDIKDLAVQELMQLVKKHGTQKAAAGAIGIHPSYLGEMLAGSRDISDNVLEKLGMTRVSVHVRKDEVPQVVSAIESALTERKGFQRLRERVIRR